MLLTGMIMYTEWEYACNETCDVAIILTEIQIYIYTRCNLPALPGIQNIQQANFFVKLQLHRKKPQTFSIVMIISRFVAA